MLLSSRTSFRDFLIGRLIIRGVYLTRNRTRFHAGDSSRRCRVRSGGHNQVRALRMPAITNREVDRFNITLLKQLRKFRLISVGEKGNGAGVVSKRTQLPARLIKPTDG